MGCVTQLMREEATTGLGGSVGVRPYSSEDAIAVGAMRLSPRSLYERFFSGTPRLPVHYARMLDRVDHHDREALVALDGSEVIGVAEYVRDEDAPALADLAVMVADARQRQGVGRTLVTAVADLAWTRGIRLLRADVLAGNAGANAAVRSGWPDAPAIRGDGGTLGYLLPLPSTTWRLDAMRGEEYLSTTENRRSARNWAG